MTRFPGREMQRRRHQNSNAKKPSGQPRENERSRSRRRTADPGKQRDVNRNGRDHDGGQAGIDKFFRKRDAAVSAEQKKTTANGGTPPRGYIRAFRALGACNCVEQQTRREIAATGHEKWRDGIDREPNKQISRAPDQIERSKGGDDRESCWLSHTQISAEVDRTQETRAPAECCLGDYG